MVVTVANPTKLQGGHMAFFGPFLTNVTIFESHFLEIIYLAIS